MSTLFRENYFSPFDLLVKDFFKSELDFQPANQAKYSHPVDIYENPEGLYFEIACTGLTKKDIEIQIEGDILNIRYNKDNDEKCCEVKKMNKGHISGRRKKFQQEKNQNCRKCFYMQSLPTAKVSLV